MHDSAKLNLPIELQDEFKMIDDLNIERRYRDGKKTLIL
jgi:hypothetical protein